MAEGSDRTRPLYRAGLMGQTEGRHMAELDIPSYSSRGEQTWIRIRNLGKGSYCGATRFETVVAALHFNIFAFYICDVGSAAGETYAYDEDALCKEHRTCKEKAEQDAPKCPTTFDLVVSTAAR